MWKRGRDYTDYSEQGQQRGTVLYLVSIGVRDRQETISIAVVIHYHPVSITVLPA